MSSHDQDISERDKLDFLRGRAPDDLACRIQQAAEKDASLAAELALGQALVAMGDARERAPDLADDLGWKRLESAIRKDTATPGPRGSVPLWKVAAIVFALISLAQGAMLWTGSDAVRYQTATQSAPGFDLGVIFAPDATLGDISLLLQEVGARITDGPGASGFYRISFETGDAMTAAEAMLSATPLVRLVARE